MRERLLNYSHHLRRLRLMVLVAVLAVPIGAAGQNPNDNLNLDFKNGLSGWKLYHGIKDLRLGKCYWSHGDLRTNVKETSVRNGSNGYVYINSTDLFSEGYVMTPTSFYQGAVSKKVADKVNSEYLSETYRFCVVNKGSNANQKNKYDNNFAQGSLDDFGSVKNTVLENYNYWIEEDAHVLKTCKDGNYKKDGACCVSMYEGENNKFKKKDGYSGVDGVDWSIPKTGDFDRTCRIGAAYGLYDGFAAEAYGQLFGSGRTSVECMEYEFDCSEDMGLLAIDYCAIAMNPSGVDANCKLDHEDYGAPSFSIMLDTATMGKDNWSEYKEDCGEAAKTTAHMYDSKGVYGTELSKYHVVTTGWDRSIFDLTKLQGKRVRLKLTVNDCCYGYSENGDGMGAAGGHAAYMYFRAEVKPMQFDLEYCQTGDPLKVTAPEGYDYYKWFVGKNESNAKERTDITGNSHTFERYNAGDNGYVKVILGMFANTGCEKTLDTLIVSQTVSPDILFKDSCGYIHEEVGDKKIGYYRLKDATIVKMGQKDVANLVKDRTWFLYPAGAAPVINGIRKDDFYADPGRDGRDAMSGKITNIDVDQGDFVFENEDGTIAMPTVIGSEDSVDIQFPDELDPAGQYVVLKVKTFSGCEAYVCKKVKPNPEPKWTEPQGTYCEGFPIDVKFGNDLTYTYSYMNGGIEATRGLYGNLTFSIDGEKWVKAGESVRAKEIASNGLNAIDYKVRDFYGCETSARYYVEANPMPIYSMSLSVGVKDEVNSTDEETFINVCPGKQAILQFQDMEGNSYKINADDKGQSVLDQSGFYNTDPISLEPGNTYLLTVSFKGCEKTHLITVKAYENIATLINESYICAGEDAQVSVENVSLNINGVPQWYKADDQGNKVGDAIGSGITYTLTNVESVNYYMVEATDIYGCPFTQNFSVKMKNKPEIKATFSYEGYIGSVAQNRVPLNSSYADGVYTVDPVCPNADLYKSRVWFNLENTTRIASTRYRFKDITNGESANWSGWHNAGSNDVYDGYSNSTDGRNRVILVEAQSYEGGVNYCTDTIKVILQSHPKSSCALTVADFRYENNAIIPGTNTTSIYCEGTDVVLSPIHKSGPSIAEGADADVRWYDYKHDHATNKGGWNEVTVDYESAKVVDDVLTVKAIADNYNRLDGYGRQYRSYKALVKDVNGCYADPSANVYVKPLPELSLDKNADVVCEGNSISLSVVDKHAGETFKHNDLNNTIGGYLWSETRTDKDGNEVKKVLNGNNSDAHFVDMKGNSVMVKVEVTASNGCLAADSTILKSHPAFDVIMQNDAVVCSRPNGSVAENAKVELKFAAVSVAGGSALTAESFTYKVTHKQTGTDGYVVADVPRGQSAELGEFEVSDTYLDEVVEVIEVEVTSSEGCVVKKKFEITVKPYPKVYITADKDFVCDGESLELKANNGSSNIVQNPVLSWLNIGAGNVAGNAATALTGTVSFVKNDEGFVDYVAEITSGASCVAYDTFRVYSQDAPDFTVNPVPSSVCANALFTSELSASANYDSTYFYTQLGKNGNDATWSSAWTEDAVVDGGVSSAKYDVSKQAVMGSASKTYTVRAGMARYGSAGLYRTNAADPKYFCYSEKNIVIGSDEVPGVTVELLASANSADKKKVVCDYKDYYLLVTNTSSSPNMVDVVVNVEGTEKEASLTGGGTAVVGPFKPNSNADASTVLEDKVEYSWTDRVTSCESKNYMTVNFVKRPTVSIIANGGGLTNSYDSEVEVCDGAVVDLSFDYSSTSGADVANVLWSYGSNTNKTESIQITANMLQPSLLYNLNVTDVNGCEADMETLKVNVVATPKFTAWLSSQDKGVCEGGTDSLIVSDNNNLGNAYTYSAYVYDAVANDVIDSPIPGKEMEKSEPVLDENGKQEMDENGTPKVDVKKYYLFELSNLNESLSYKVVAKSNSATECTSSMIVTTKVNKLPVLDIKMTNTTTKKSGIGHDENGKFPAVCQNDQVQFVISNTTADPSVSTTYKLRRVTANAFHDKYSLVTASGTGDGTTDKLTIDKSHRYEITATTSLGCEVVAYVDVPIKSSVSLATKGNHSTLNYSYLCRDKADNEKLVTLDGNNHMFQIWIDNTSNLSKDDKSWTITGDYINGEGDDYDDIKFDLSKAYQAFENVAGPDMGKTSTTFKLMVTDNQGCSREVTHTVRFSPDPDFGKILDNVSPNPVCSEDGKVEVSLENTEVVSYVTYTHALSAANLGKSTGKTFKEELKFDGLNANGKVEVDYYAGYKLTGSYNYAGKNMLCVSTKKVEVDVIYKPEFTVEVLKNGAVVNGGDKLCIGDEFSFRLNEVGTVHPKDYSDIVTYTITDMTAKDAIAPLTVDGNFGKDVSSAAITADKTRTFLITAKASKGCAEVTTKVTVSVEQPFDVRIISDNQSSVAGVSEVCEGGSLTLTALSNTAVWAGTGSAYQWSTGADAESVLLKDVRVAEQTFSLKVRNSNGCWSNEAKHKVKTNPNPMAIVDGKREDCVGSNAEITANGSSVASGSILKYTWLSVAGGANGTFGDADDVYTELSNGTTFDKPFVSGLNKYALVVESDKRCADTALFDLMGRAKPQISVYKIDGTQQNPTLMSCIGTPMTLQASNSNSQDNEFEWYDVNNESLGTGEQIIVTPTSVANVIFKVKVTDGAGCENEGVFTYGAYSLPKLSVVGNTSCDGDVKEIIASDSRPDAALFDTKFYWNNSTVDNPKFEATFAPNSGPYSVVALDKNGCRAEKTVDVMVNANPTAIVKADRNQVCFGGAIELTAETSAPSVLWQEGLVADDGTITWGDVTISTSKTITPIVKEKRAYRFTAQDGKCQSVSEPFIVSPFNQASFVVSNATVCAGQNATINISDSKNVKKYYWKELGGDYKEEETVSFVIPADANEAGGKTKTYRIYGVSNDDCITAEKEFTVTINSLPTVEIDVDKGGRGGEAVRCDNGDALVFQAKITSGQTADSYEWSGATVNQDDKSKSSYSGVANGQKVRVRVVDEKGCAGIAERSVTVYSHPVIALLPAEEDGAADANIRRFCAGDEVTLGVNVERATSSISNYTWEVGETKMNWSQGSRTIALKDGEFYSETYSVQVVDGNQCVSNKASYTVNVEERPKVNSSKPEPVCPGNEVSIQLSGADTYFNEYGDELTLDGNNNFTEVIKQAKKFGFVGSVTLQDGVTVCYSDPVTVDATVREIPFVSISEDVKGSNLQSKTILACEGETLNLSAVVTGGDGKYTYSWNGAAANAEYKPTLSGGGNNGVYTYDLVVRDGEGSGCPVTASVSFKAQPTPVVSISTDKDAVCNESEAVNLKACTNADCSVDEEGKYSYNWLVDGEVHSSGVDVNSMVLRNVKGSTNVSVTVKDIAVGCIAAPVSITIDKLGAPVFTIYDEAGKDILDPAYGNVMVCPGDYEQLIVEAKGNEALSSYKWRGINSDDVLSTSQNFNTPVFEEAKEAHYIVEVEGQNGCFASKNFSVTVKPLPKLTLAGPRTGLCEGTTATFTVSSLDENTTFDWLQPVPSTDNYIDVELKGSELQVKVAAILNGCSVSKDSVFKIYQNPVIDIVTDAEATSNSICEGSFVQLEAKNQSASLAGKVTWSWRKNTGTTRFGNEPVISDNPNVTTTYTLTGTARHNSSNICVVSKDIVVNVIENPEIRANFHPSAEVCSNESVELRLDGADFYAWNKGAAYDEKNSEELESSTIAIGTDFVVGTTNNYTIAGMKEYKYPNGTLNCVSEKTVGLKVYAAPSVSVSAPSKACPDTEITLIATGADNYSWVGTGKLSDGVTDLNGATSSIINLIPGSSNQTFSYSVIGSEIVDVVTQKVCSTKANVAVEVLPKSKISFGEVDSVCIGDYAVIKATGVSIGGKQPYVDFIWSTGEMGDSISYLITKDSKITVTGRDTNNCFVDETVEIKAQDPAGFDIKLADGVNTTVCEGSAVTLQVEGATEYKWEDDPENTTSQMQVSPVSNTSYTVEGTYGVCTKKLTIPVYIVSAPAISIVGNTVVCRNSRMNLQATSQTEGLVFKWEGTDADGDKLSVVPTIDGEKYIVTATDPNGKYCKASKSVTVTLREEPNVKISGDLTVCENTYADLNVGGAVSYVWGYEDADGNPVNNVAGGTNYQPKIEDKDLVVFVDGTDSYGCKGSDKVTVSHVAPPSVKINGVDQICAGQAVSLTAGGNAETYVWNGKDTSASVNEALETSKTYSLKGISTEGCVAETRLLVTVVQNPILSLSGNTTLCQGDVLRVKAHGADSYTWGGGASPDGYPDSMSMKMPEAGIREVALTGVTGGCSTTQNFEINVKKAPSVQIEGDKETCANVSLPLKAVSEDEITTYTWTNNLNNVSLAGQSVSPVITQDVTYTVKAGNIYGCAGTETINVKVVSSPDLIVSANIEFGKPLKETTLEFNDLGVAYVSVCDGTDLDLQVRGAKTFKWDHRDSVYTSYTSLDTTITSSATFVVTGFITGCDASRTIVVNHKANPSIDLLGKRVVCEGSPVTLEPIGTDSFEWNGKGVVPEEDGSKLIAFTPTVKNFKYTLVGIDTVNNCQTVRTYTDISFNSKPEFTVSGEKEVCVNESITLNAFAVDPANDEGNYSYTWGYDKDSKKAFDLDSELEVTAFEAGVDQLFASVKDSVGCVDTLFFEVTKKPLPTLTFDAKGSDNDPSTPEIIDICMKNDLYAYINGGGASITQENGKVSSTIKDKPVKDTIYKVSGELNGCVNTLEIPVRTIPSPIVYLTNYAEDEELTYCEGSPVKLVVGGNAVSYTMPDGTKGANGATYVDEEADGLMTYFITGEGDNGCSVQEEFTFKMNTLPEVAIDIEKDQDRICYREVAELHVTGAESYKWSTGSRKDTIKATITKDSVFTVVGKDGNGCESEVSFKVTMVELPVLAYNGDTEFCDGNTATLRGSGTGVGGGDYYAWSIGKDTIAMGNLATTKLNGNTTYTLWGKSKEGCVSSLDVDITAKEAPILFWEGEYELNETADSILLCQKQTLDITMKGADTYQWTGGSTTDRLTVVPTRSTHYTVTGTGANGCKTTQAINVKVLPTPTIKIDAPTFACVGEDFQMKVTDDTKDNFESFAWSNHSTEATSGDLTMTEEDYTLKVTGYTSLNCPAEASFTVKPKALPKLYVRGTKEICKGGVFSLHGQGANTYAWFMDENDYYGNDTAKVGDQISFEAATDEVLVMSGTLNGCTDTIHVPLSVQTPPILHTEGLKPICQGEVLELIAKATNVNEEDKVEFSWSAGSVSGELGDTMRMTPLSSQEIYLTGSVVLLDENGEQIYCKNTLEIPVTVNTKPTIEVEGERTVCYGTEAKFTAVGAAAYEWVELESSSETVRPIITSDTSLTVRGKDTGTGCDAEAVVKVKVKPLPVLGVANGSKVILCDGEEADITVFGAATYGWRQPDGSLVAGNRYKHTPEQDTIYRVIGTSNNNCVDSMDIEVTVNMLPSLSYSGDSEICSGDSLILFGHSAPEGCTFSWSNGDKGDKMEAKPLVSATYTLTGKDGNGCVTSMEIPVVVNQRTPLNLAGTSNVCAGSQAEVYVVDAEGFTAFNWSNGNVGENIKPHVSEKTTFTAEGIDVNGCVTKAEFTVNVTEIPVLSFHGDTVVCLGDEVSLLADGAGMYNWRDVDGNLLSDKARYTFKPDVETKLILEGYMSNCKAEREIPIMVNAVPNLEVDMPEFICRGSVGELRATAGAGVTFEWSTGETEKVIEVAPNKSTYYTVTATNEHGCDSTVKRTVLVVEPPMVTMGTNKLNDMVCPGQPDSVYFSATGAVSYEWSSVPAVADIDIYNSDKQNFWAVLNEGEDVVVTVVGTDEKGCQTSVTRTIAQRELEPMQFVINPNCIDESNTEVRFAGKIPDHESAVWTWTPGEGLDPVTARNNTAGGLVYKYDLPLKDSFEVKVRSVDEHGCIQEGSGWVYKWKDFWAAEAFTPDGDGLNDKFMFHGGDFIENFTYVIYNRMGEVIFEGKGIEDEWDGNYKGEPCPTGVYGWTVRYDNNSATLSKKGERKGMVTIVR